MKNQAKEKRASCGVVSAQGWEQPWPQDGHRPSGLPALPLDPPALIKRMLQWVNQSPGWREADFGQLTLPAPWAGRWTLSHLYPCMLQPVMPDRGYQSARAPRLGLTHIMNTLMSILVPSVSFCLSFSLLVGV